MDKYLQACQRQGFGRVRNEPARRVPPPRYDQTTSTEKKVPARRASDRYARSVSSVDPMRELQQHLLHFAFADLRINES